MNPFSSPDRLYISKRPQDMRAGMQRLASIVTTDFDMDPADGALYVFISRDCEKIKALRFETDGWCLCYIRLCEGGFRWAHRPDDPDPTLQIGRTQLSLLLAGLDLSLLKQAPPITAKNIL